MALSFTEYPQYNGVPIAHVIHPEKPKLKKMVYMYDKKVPDGEAVIELGIDESFEKAIDSSQEREVMYVSGMSGAGTAGRSFEIILW